MQFPPPHTVFYERLNDRVTQETYAAYKSAHAHEADFEEIDAAVMSSMDDFAKWFGQWMTFAPSRPGVRCRILMVWHSHFLTLACQQMLRRLLEQRSFRCRVFFHIEEPTLQGAIVSRCIVRNLGEYRRLPKIVGSLNTDLWNDPRAYETKLQEAKDN